MKLICQRCGIEFKTRNRTRKYCSRECYHLARAVRVSSVCLQCGEEFAVLPHDLDKRKYCSRVCKWASQRKLTEYTCQQCGGVFVLNLAKSKRKYCSLECTHRASDTRITVSCEVCGKAILVRKRAYHQEGLGKFCSNACRYRGIRNRESSSWKAGCREDLGDTYFRSSWEANYARLC